MAAGNHPDFFAVARSEEKNELTIDVMLELCRALSLKPARGRGKIALLDNADDLNAESSNAFLKTLEEPPPGSVFFLIGTSTERQLPTLVSRCQVVRFAPLSDEGTADILRRQGISDDRTLNRLVRLARGSPGQALALAEAALWEFRQVLLDGLLQPSPDSATLSKRWVEFVEENGKDGPAQRRLATLVIRLLLEFFDDALSVRLGGTPRLGDPEELVNLRKLADRAEPDMLLKLLDRCLEADVQAGRYVQLVLVQEALLDALAALLATT
jgi:DNA polymerase-3 subunit delta'